MRPKLSAAFALAGTIFLLSFYSPIEKDKGKIDPVKEQAMLKVSLQSIKDAHYSPLPIDDKFSENVFKLYLERLDYNKKFFLKEDITKLSKYKTLIDNEVNELKFDFFNLSVELIDTRIKEAQEYYKAALAQPFDFTAEETINVDPEKIEFAPTKEKLKDDWRKAMKYQVMTTVLSKLEVQDKAKEKNDTSVTIKSFEELEADARKKILSNHDEWFGRLFKMERSDRLTAFINTMANVNDPHTEYFPPADKENFDIGMSGQLEGIGAQLSEKDGYIEVTHIVPGSPSYRQGSLKEGDIILKVAQGNDDAVDVVDMRLDNVVKLVRGKKGTKVRLTIKKKLDASIEEITITRDVVIIEDSYAKSAVIEKDGVKYGYIFLPKFYFPQQGGQGRYCATDIKKELEKLKTENIIGIVFDLRNNGGGSLNEVVDMAGLFIDKGPIVQVKSRTGAPSVMNDRAAGEIYDGPMVVLVNSFSASASEILAAAMQDYKRAVIVGSPSTFGKGTVQQFVNLDDYLMKNYESFKPLGEVKVTMRKFYRVNGGATQLKGVIPDIILPDDFSRIDVGEKEQDYPMKWDEIPASEYQTFKPTDWKLDTDALKKKSKQRTDTTGFFKLKDENAKRIEKQKDNSTYSLNLEKYKAEMKKLKEEAKKFETPDKENNNIKLDFIEADYKAMESDTAKVSREKKWLSALNKDAYIYESLYIIKDMK